MPTPSPEAATAREIRDTCLCLATQAAARRLARRFDRAFAPFGITNQQFSLMVALSSGAGLRMGELARMLGMEAGTLTAAVRTLERRGLAALEADGADARARRPRLTPEGREVVARAVPVWRAEHARLAATLPEAAALAAPGLLAALA